MSTTRPDVRRRLLDFAWEQWGQMGVFAAATRHDRWVMDPEALIVFTLGVGRSDPRLFDELLDWMWRNGRMVSVQRLQNLSRGDEEQERLVAAALQWVSASNGSLKLPPIRARETTTDAEPLFTVDDSPLRITRLDPVFASLGLLRQVALPTGRSTPPDVHEPINLALRLRHLFGLGARAECVRSLLTDARTELSVADVASVAGYAKRNVADALRSLATAAVIIERPSGNERRYRLDRRRWADFLQVDLTAIGPHRNWPALLRSLAMIDRWTAAKGGAMSDQMRASSARDLLERIGPDLAAAGVPLPPASRPGAGYLTGFWASLEAALALLEGDAATR